ncbi:MAG: response regulator transcription factor [Bacteroidota bacterium]
MKRLNILVIDSEPITYLGLKSIFKNSLIFNANQYLDSGKNLEETLNEFKIDIIISDIKIIDSNAFEILKFLKKNKIEIPLIIFTSIKNKNKSVQLLKLGATGFITKNMRKKSIRDSIQEIAFSKYESKELNKFTRLKNRFNFNYNTEKINSLSKREVQVLKLFFRGKKNIEISSKLDINQKTVNTYISRIMKKLEVNSRTELFLLVNKHVKQLY